MAIEARQLNPFPPQHIPNKNLLHSNEANVNTRMGSVFPVAGTSPENLLPFPPISLLGPAKTLMSGDSGVTHAAMRKRSRSDSVLKQICGFTIPGQECILSALLGDDIPLRINQQQLDIDHILAEHTEKIKVEMEERNKQHARELMWTIGGRMEKHLKDKDDQILRMCLLNTGLQEKVRSLSMENQLWKDLAQSNEAAANSLRVNLEQVLARHVSNQRRGGGLPAVMDDAESFCGSNEYCKRRRVDGEEDEAEVASGGGGNRMCKRCGERESSVLVLRCRHLCLCCVCVSSNNIKTCPVCNSTIEGTLRVNLS